MIEISYTSNNKKTACVALPGSKSIYNRLLIINAVSGNIITIQNPSVSNDSKILENALNGNKELVNVEDAGTAMRFLTGFYAFQKEQHTLTGSSRMKQRPIDVLVDGLNKLGAEIEYIENEGFPPLKIKTFKKCCVDKLELNASISSQFISSILMVLPLLERDFEIVLKNTISSEPYIDLTIHLMKKCGAQINKISNEIIFNKSSYLPTTISVEADWSAASYWYSIVSITKKTVVLKNMNIHSFQGDKILMKWYEHFGVTTECIDNDLVLKNNNIVSDSVEFNFSNYPDLAQTVLVTASALKIPLKCTGLQSLTIKETNRIEAMKLELKKIGAELIQIDEHKWKLNINNVEIPEKIHIKTYSDHRMAMSFAPLAFYTNLIFENQEVVIKSYPSFWNDLSDFGFLIKHQ